MLNFGAQKQKERKKRKKRVYFPDVLRASLS
jgi:hypothetical protein